MVAHANDQVLKGDGITLSDLQLIFGNADQRREAIYARYAMGDPVSKIAADTGLSAERVYAIMREKPEDYEQSKQAREDFTGLRIQRQLSLVDSINLELLERVIEGDEMITPALLEKMSKMVKDLSHRWQLHRGKATDIIKADESMSLDELKKRIREVEDAGDGLVDE